MRTYHPYLATLVCCFVGAGSPSMADRMVIKSCDETPFEIGPTFTHGSDCTITWIDNNRMRTVIWSQVEDDHQGATLDQSNLGNPILTSGDRPELIDVDNDGWLDLVTFIRVGMVNGQFDVFFYDPAANQFAKPVPLYGHSLLRDTDGYLAVTARSGPGWVNMFYTGNDGELTYLFEVEPYGSGQSGSQFGDRCDVSAGEQNPLSFDDVLASNQIPDASAFFTSYCAPEPLENNNGRTAFLQEVAALTDRVPENTVFYCVLDGSTHAVTITSDPQHLYYSYGPIGGAVELALDNPRHDVLLGVEQNHVAFETGDYNYIVTRDNAVSDFSLAVYKDETSAPVFQKGCVSKRTYDAIFSSLAK
jgi:hypothetical protein